MTRDMAVCAVTPLVCGATFAGVALALGAPILDVIPFAALAAAYGQIVMDLSLPQPHNTTGA